MLIAVSARMRSERCPGKAMATLAGKPLLIHLLERLASLSGKRAIVVATSVSSENDVLVEAAETHGIRTFRGVEDDVLGRLLALCGELGAEHLVRVTGDNPLTDLPLIETLVALHLKEDSDYTYVPGGALLMGILTEVISRSALETSHRDGEDRHRSELVTLYIKENPERFRIARAELPEELYRPHYRLTVDEPDDLVLMGRIFDKLYRSDSVLSTADAIRLLDEEPALAAINAHIAHAAHNIRSVKLDDK